MPEAPADSIGTFVARVLETLSVTSWFPSLTLTGGAMVLWDAGHHDGPGVEVFSRLANGSFGQWAVFGAAVVAVNVLLQPFQFAFIRLLEGYWGTRGLGGFFSERVTRRMQRARTDAHKRAATEGQIDDDDLRQRLLEMPLDAEASSHPGPELAQVGGGDTAIGHAGIDARRYPLNQKDLMPTRLGNLLRRAERDAETVAPTPSRLREIAVERFDEPPLSVQGQLDLHRSRLDLYCTLWFVGLALAGPAVVVVIVKHDRLLLVAVTLGLMLASYRAALGAADSYGECLRAASRSLARRDAQA